MLAVAVAGATAWALAACWTRPACPTCAPLPTAPAQQTVVVTVADAATPAWAHGLLPSSPLDPIDAELASCAQEEQALLSPDDVHAVLTRARPPALLTRRAFVCSLQCAAREPELESSLRYLGNGARFSVAGLRKLCDGGHVQVLVRIKDNVPSFARCVDRVTATQHLTAVSRELAGLARLARLPDAVFAFDTGDFSRPRTKDPEGLAWTYTEPGIVRFVGDASHPALLWPTLPYMTTTAYCKLGTEFGGPGKEAQWFTRCRNVEPADRVPWERKRDLVFWRGSPTGGTIDPHHGPFTPRVAFSTLFRREPGFDVSYASDAVPPYATKAFIAQHSWKPRAPRAEFGASKMVVSLDGHTASWGLIEKLSLGSVLLWHESLRGYREFYYALLRPWVHYVPIAADFSNLARARDFVLARDTQPRARAVAEAATRLIDERMRPQDAWCYMARLVWALGEHATSPSVESWDHALAGLEFEPMTGAWVEKVKVRPAAAGSPQN